MLDREVVVLCAAAAKEEECDNKRAHELYVVR